MRHFVAVATALFLHAGRCRCCCASSSRCSWSLTTFRTRDDKRHPLSPTDKPTSDDRQHPTPNERCYTPLFSLKHVQKRMYKKKRLLTVAASARHRPEAATTTDGNEVAKCYCLLALGARSLVIIVSLRQCSRDAHLENSRVGGGPWGS